MKSELSTLALEELWKLFPIELKPYNQNYPKWYSEESSRVLGLLNHSSIFRISHIGSTYIKDIVSKPIVDMLLEVKQNCDTTDIISTLENNGYILMNEQYSPSLRLSFNKGYTVNGYEEKVFHLHVVYEGNCKEIYFRDYLNTHSNVAKDYEALKIRLAQIYKNNRDEYTRQKTEFVLKYSKN